MIFNSVKPLVYMLKLKEINIYDSCFKMHTKLTVYFLILFSFLVSCHAYSGKPIDCIIGDKGVKSIAENICWVNGTFTLRNSTEMVNGRETWANIPHYQRYYQWIVSILMLQAALFTIPQRLWKSWEHGRVQQLCGSLSSPVITPDSPDFEKGKQRIVSYLRLNNSRIHGAYVFRYVACEIMNFLIVVTNMFVLNVIFDRFWTRYLPAVVALFKTEGKIFSTLASEIFPIMAKCTYTDVGPSGSTQIHDALCLLTLNIINEKVFAFLYVWYVLLLIVSGCNLIWRSVILLSSTIRFKMIQSLSKWTVPLSKKKLKIILKGDNVGDWFIIFLIGQNINPFVFRDILDELAEGKGTLNNNI